MCLLVHRACQRSKRTVPIEDRTKRLQPKRGSRPQLRRDAPRLLYVMKLLAFAVLATLLACSDVHTDLVPLELGGPAELDSGTGPGDAAIAPDAAALPMCGKKVCKCADGKDDDRDGLIDGADPECTSPMDDDEDTFGTGGPKAPPNECEDCFWDGNDSADDDGCMYPAVCRSEGPSAMPGPPMPAPGMSMMCRSCDVAPRCIDTCRSRTPNGCDCFGCCEITGADGVPVHVVLSDECAVKHVGNAGKCPSCVPNPECFNPCGPCELCFGKTAEQVAAQCADAGMANGSVTSCDDGYESCSEDSACAQGYYCVLGCCMVTVF